MKLGPVPIERPRGTILDVAAPIPNDPQSPWWTDGVSLNRRPLGRPVISSNCLCDPATPVPALSVDTLDKTTADFYPYTLETALESLAFNAMSPSVKKVVADMAAEHLDVDLPYLLSLALQLGVDCGGARTSPGFASLPTGVGPGMAATLSSVGPEAALTGAASTLPKAITLALDFWRNFGFPGVALISVPSQLLPFFATHNLVDNDATTGGFMLAGGMARLAFGPGFDPTVGPGGQVAPIGTAWVWISGNVYVAHRAPESLSGDHVLANRSLALETASAIHAFDPGAVAAVLVEVE